MEIIAAVVGALLGLGASGISGYMRRDSEDSKAVIRLTAGVEHIAREVSMLRSELREDLGAVYPRLNTIEQRLAALEAHQH
jgi:hypothetical protein